MTGPTHKRIGAATATIATAALLPTTLLAVLLIPTAYLTSTLPDRLERWVPALMPWRWRPELRLHWIPFRIRVIPLTHRRVTHYPETVVPGMIAMAALAATLGTLSALIAAGAAIGVLMHLAADACTITGLPSLTYTLRGRPERRTHLLPAGLRVRTGGTIEPWVRRCITLATLAIVAAVVWLQGNPTPDVDWRILAGIATAFVLLTAPARSLIRAQRVKLAWTTAVIHSGAADPPRQTSRKRRQLTGPRATRVQKCAVGDRLTIRISRSNSFLNLEKHAGEIANNLDKPWYRVRELRLHQHPHRASKATATVVLRDPFHNAPATTSPLLRAATTSVWDPMPLGVDEEGREVALQWAPDAAGHTLIAGITGSGKSVCAHTFIAHTALDPNARLVLLDPNQVQFHHWQACTGLPVIGPNPLDAVRALETVQAHMQHRFAALQQTGQWLPSREDPTYTVVIDEATKYIDRTTKPARELSDQFTGLVLDMLQRGRAAGVRLIVITQRPSAEIFPSDLRAQFPNRIGFRVGEPETTQMIFGTRDIPAHKIPADGHTGVGYLGTDTGAPTRIRAHYLTQDHIKTISDRAAEHRRHHALAPRGPVIDLTAPLPLSSPSPEPKAAETRAQRDRARLLEVLPVTAPGFDRSRIEADVGPWQQVKRTLDLLVKDGQVIRDGAGRPGDPYRYKQAVQGRAHDRAQPANPGVEPDGGSVHGSPP